MPSYKAIIFLLVIYPLISYANVNKDIEQTFRINCIVELERGILLGGKVYFQGRKGMFLGYKGNFGGPEGKKYNWDQNRAETYYDSEFKGYSDPYIQGFNFGYSHQIIDCLHFSVGIGFCNSVQYREYYDATFTEWSKNYYITDNMIDKWNTELLFGSYYRLKKILISLGYSTLSDNLIFGIGWSSEL